MINNKEVFNQQEAQSKSNHMTTWQNQRRQHNLGLQHVILSHSPTHQITCILNVIVNLRECDSRKLCTCCVTTTVYWQPYFGILVFVFVLRSSFQGPSSSMVLLLASFFSILIPPDWFHRLINVKHQKLVSLITVRKGFKNSGICASEQRLYQLVPVTASWEKENSTD